MFYTLITNTVENTNLFEDNPLINDIQLVTDKKDSINNLDNVNLINGFELGIQLFQDKVKLDNNKIDKNIYWVDNEIKTCNKQLELLYNNFVFNHYKRIDIISLEQLNDILSVKKSIKYIIYFDELLSKIDKKIISFYIEEDNISSKILYFVDIETINYFEDKEYDNFISVFQSCSFYNYVKDKCVAYKNIKLLLRQFGLVDKKFDINSIIDFVLINLDYHLRNKVEEIILFLFVHFMKSHYNEINVNECDKNLINIENYLSSIYINSIDIYKYSDISFPHTKYGINYKYNGSYSTTGRIYPIDLKSDQSLQTIPFDKKDVLNADNKCMLIEYDYISAEFDVIFNLCDITFTDDTDHHYDIIKELIDNDLLKKYDYNYIRKVGKSINYPIIYGSDINNVLNVLKNSFDVKDDAEIKKISDKIDINEHFNRIKEFRIDLINNRVDHVNRRFKNYFERWIRYKKNYAILNNYVQSTFADFLYFKIHKIILLVKDTYDLNENKNKILLQNHDSILIQLEEKVIENTNILNDMNEILLSNERKLKGRIKRKMGTNWKFLQ